MKRQDGILEEIDLFIGGMIMINIKTRILMAAAFVILGGGIITANAQLAPNSSLKVHVPFSFMVNDRMFGPGLYTVSRTQSFVAPRQALILHGRNNGGIVLNTIGTNKAQPAKHSGFVFDRFGNTYYLSAILFKGSTYRNEIPKRGAHRDIVARSRTRTVTLIDTGF